MLEGSLNNKRAVRSFFFKCHLVRCSSSSSDGLTQMELKSAGKSPIASTCCSITNRRLQSRLHCVGVAESGSSLQQQEKTCPDGLHLTSLAPTVPGSRMDLYLPGATRTRLTGQESCALGVIFPSCEQNEISSLTDCPILLAALYAVFLFGCCCFT